MKHIIVLALAVFSVFFAFGQTPEDTVKVYFHIGRWQFDPALDGNEASMKKFIDRVRLASEKHNLDRVVIRAYASPEGSETLNKRLSEKRCATIASLIEKGAGISAEYIESIPEGVAWTDLRKAVAANPDVPSRAKVLDIIDNTPIWVFDSKGRVISSRRKQLMDLSGGRPWQWMFKNIFPMLRNSIAISFVVKPDSAEPANSVMVESIEESQSLSDDNQNYIAGSDSITISDTIIASDSITASNSAAASDSIQTIEVGREFSETEIGADSHNYPPQYALALKTNLLYYAILLPNIELEWLINKHWSVVAEGNWAQWGSYKRERSYRITLLDAEGRYWIKPRSSFHGFYVGVMAGGGWYDLEKGTPGHYGWGVMSGVTAGYMWPITRRLSFDAEIGAGYLYTRYKDYRPYEGHHVYLRTKDLNYFGPIKLKFSLAWRFFEVKKPKTTIPAL